MHANFHFSPDQLERRSRTALLYVGVHGAAAKASALSAVVCVASYVSALCMSVCMYLLDTGLCFYILKQNLLPSFQKKKTTQKLKYGINKLP